MQQPLLLVVNCQTAHWDDAHSPSSKPSDSVLKNRPAFWVAVPRVNRSLHHGDWVVHVCQRRQLPSLLCGTMIAFSSRWWQRPRAGLPWLIARNDEPSRLCYRLRFGLTRSTMTCSEGRSRTKTGYLCSVGRWLLTTLSPSARPGPLADTLLASRTPPSTATLREG